VIGGTARARVQEAVASAKVRLAAKPVPELETAGVHS
jgi:hypothetical protein